MARSIVLFGGYCFLWRLHLQACAGLPVDVGVGGVECLFGELDAAFVGCGKGEYGFAPEAVGVEEGIDDLGRHECPYREAEVNGVVSCRVGEVFHYGGTARRVGLFFGGTARRLAVDIGGGLRVDGFDAI